MSRVYDDIISGLKQDIVKFSELKGSYECSTYLRFLKYNILSELNDWVKKTNRKVLSGSLTKSKTIQIHNYNLSSNNLVNHLIGIGESYHFITTASQEQNNTIISVYPSYTKTKEFNIILYGYIGNRLHQYSSAMQIEESEMLYPIMRSICDPHTYEAGEYVNNLKLNNSCNKSQKKAIQSIADRIHIIHGPPGTGKSTTIANIIKGRIPPTHNILCTAVQNQAVENICIKLVEADIIDFLVIGSDGVIGECASTHTLEYKYQNNVLIKEHIGKKNVINADIQLIQQSMDDNLIISKIVKKYELYNRKVSDIIDKLYGLIKQLDSEIQIEKQQIIEKSRIILCTVDSSYKIYNMVKKDISTIILDEAGYIQEVSILPLIRLKPINIILIGDHKQLSPYAEAHQTNIYYYKSLLERMIEAERKHSVLNIQYRMPRKLCEMVSDIFYNNLLVSSESKDNNDRCYEWVNVVGEEKSDDTKSYYNMEEVDAIKKICDNLAGSRIMVLCAYSTQVKKVKEAIGQIKDVDVRTLDKSQGAEEDIVIISLVRTKNVGFLSDKRRLCVGLSRAKKYLYVVGCYDLFKKSGGVCWKQIIKYME
jgi:superfamily I DNA and/or RNA helicase